MSRWSDVTCLRVGRGRRCFYRSPLGVGPPPDRRELTHQLKSGPAVAGSRKAEEFFAEAFFVDHTSRETEAHAHTTPAQRARARARPLKAKLPAWSLASPLRTLSR